MRLWIKNYNRHSDNIAYDFVTLEECLNKCKQKLHYGLKHSADITNSEDRARYNYLIVDSDSKILYKKSAIIGLLEKVNPFTGNDAKTGIEYNV